MYFDEQTTSGVLKDFIQHVEKHKGPADMLAKWTVLNSDGKRRFNASLSELQAVDNFTYTNIAANVPFYMSSLSCALESNEE